MDLFLFQVTVYIICDTFRRPACVYMYDPVPFLNHLSTLFAKRARADFVFQLKEFYEKFACLITSSVTETDHTMPLDEQNLNLFSSHNRILVVLIVQRYSRAACRWMVMEIYSSILAADLGDIDFMTVGGNQYGIGIMIYKKYITTETWTWPAGN